MGEIQTRGQFEESASTLDELRRFLASQLVDGVDYGEIPGTSGKTLYQEGADKVLMLSNAYPTYDVTRIEGDERNHVEYLVRCRAVSRATQQCVAEGWGSCSTREERYRFRTTERLCPECGKPAIIKSRPERGGGWYCFPKKEGCGRNFPADDKRVRPGGKAEAEDVSDNRNTVLQMACKRARVKAVEGFVCLQGILGARTPHEPDVVPRAEEPPRRATPPARPFRERIEVALEHNRPRFREAFEAEAGRPPGPGEARIATADEIGELLWDYCVEMRWIPVDQARHPEPPALHARLNELAQEHGEALLREAKGLIAAAMRQHINEAKEQV